MFNPAVSLINPPSTNYIGCPVAVLVNAFKTYLSFGRIEDPYKLTLLVACEKTYKICNFVRLLWA